MQLQRSWICRDGSHAGGQIIDYLISSNSEISTILKDFSIFVHHEKSLRNIRRHWEYPDDKKVFLSMSKNDGRSDDDKGWHRGHWGYGWTEHEYGTEETERQREIDSQDMNVQELNYLRILESRAMEKDKWWSNIWEYEEAHEHDQRLYMFVYLIWSSEVEY